MSRAVRGLDVAMAAVFAFSASVQFNDPDPARWVAIYGAAGALAALPALRRRVPSIAVVFVGAVAAAWALAIMLSGPPRRAYGHMFDAWEMRSANIEEAREASGLFIVAVWMTVLYVRGLRPSARLVDRA